MPNSFDSQSIRREPLTIRHEFSPLDLLRIKGSFVAAFGKQLS
jgi:hypothetical protein